MSRATPREDRTGEGRTGEGRTTRAPRRVTWLGPGGREDEPVLPARAAEDTDRAWSERPGADPDDERILREVPPHWG